MSLNLLISISLYIYISVSLYPFKSVTPYLFISIFLYIYLCTLRCVHISRHKHFSQAPAAFQIRRLYVEIQVLQDMKNLTIINNVCIHFNCPQKDGRKRKLPYKPLCSSVSRLVSRLVWGRLACRLVVQSWFPKRSGEVSEDLLIIEWGMKLWSTEISRLI